MQMGKLGNFAHTANVARRKSWLVPIEPLGLGTCGIIFRRPGSTHANTPAPSGDSSAAPPEVPTATSTSPAPKGILRPLRTQIRFHPATSTVQLGRLPRLMKLTISMKSSLRACGVPRSTIRLFRLTRCFTFGYITLLSTILLTPTPPSPSPARLYQSSRGREFTISSLKRFSKT